MTLLRYLTGNMPFGEIIVPFGILIMLPLIGLIMMGLDRKISARMQNRIGPPIMQPFYDIFKLMKKAEQYTNKLALVFAVAHLAFMVTTALFVVFQQDLIVIFFTLTLSMIFKALGAFATSSPYSFLGGYRQLIRTFAVETLFLMAIVTIGIDRGTFMVSDILLNTHTPMIIMMPLTFLVMVLVFIVAMEKPPFNIPAAHTEIVQGPLSDYSGRWFALFKIAHAVELGIMMLALYFFFFPYLPIGIIVIALAFFVVILIGNATTRTTYKGMVKFSFTVGLGLVLANMLFIILV